VKHPKGVLEDLQEYREVLEKLKAARLEWHFEIDF
jgi:hypothetical protein